MNFWASAEVFKDADPGLNTVRRNVEPFLNAAFAVPPLATVTCKLLRYVPIVMPAEMRVRYPARSKVHRKQSICDCAPQLNYEVFVDGTFEDQLREYLNGIATASPHLSKLGASTEQIAAFERILADAVERILVERPDQVRH